MATSCYDGQISTCPTDIGRENYIKSIKKINYNHRRAKKYQRQERRRIHKLQNLDVYQKENE
jgi:nickel-dependent lactate racemase